MESHQEKVLELYRSLGCLEQSELSELSESLGSRNRYSNIQNPRTNFSYSEVALRVLQSTLR